MLKVFKVEIKDCVFVGAENEDDAKDVARKMLNGEYVYKVVDLGFMDSRLKATVIDSIDKVTGVWSYDEERLYTNCFSDNDRDTDSYMLRPTAKEILDGSFEKKQLAKKKAKAKEIIKMIQKSGLTLDEIKILDVLE